MQTAVLFALLFAAIQSSVIKQYYYVSLHKTWEGARLYCIQNNTDLHYSELAFVDSQSDLEDLLRSAAGVEFSAAWIGLHRDPDNFTVWKWSGRPGEVTFTNWNTGEPNYHLERAVLANRHGKWFDFRETYARPFFCVRVHGVEETKKSWEEAVQHCREVGSDLLSLHSEHSSNPTAQSLWVGLRFLAGRWLWVGGEPLWHQAWSTAVAEGPQDHQCPLTTCCGALSPDGVWEARDCQERLGFICENPLW